MSDGGAEAWGATPQRLGVCAVAVGDRSGEASPIAHQARGALPHT